MDFAIRRALPQDAVALVAVLEPITAERVHSAIIRPWTVDQQRRYLESLSPREVSDWRRDFPSLAAPL